MAKKKNNGLELIINKDCDNDSILTRFIAALEENPTSKRVLAFFEEEDAIIKDIKTPNKDLINQIKEFIDYYCENGYAEHSLGDKDLSDYKMLEIYLKNENLYLKKMSKIFYDNMKIDDIDMINELVDIVCDRSKNIGITIVPDYECVDDSELDLVDALNGGPLLLYADDIDAEYELNKTSLITKLLTLLFKDIPIALIVSNNDPNKNNKKTEVYIVTINNNSVTFLDAECAQSILEINPKTGERVIRIDTKYIDAPCELPRS